MRLRRLWWLVLPAALALALALWWLLATASGLSWAWQRASAWLPGTLTATQVSGRLAGSLHITGLRYATSQFELTARRVELEWRPWGLLRGDLYLARLTLAHGALTLHPGKGSAVAAPRWPLALRVDHGAVEDFDIALPDRAPVRLDHLAFGGRLAAGPGRRSRLQLKWTLTYEQRAIAGNGIVSGRFAAPDVAFRLTAPFAAHGHGKVAWQAAPPRWDATIEVAPLVLSRLVDTWPELSLGGRLRLQGKGAAVSVAGNGRVAGNGVGNWTYRGRLHYGANGWQLPLLVLRPQGGAGSAELSGVWAGGDGAGRITLQWRGLRVPQLAGWSSDGRLQAAGVPGAYHGDTTLSVAGRIPLQATAAFHGDLTGLTVTRLAADGLDGHWRVDGELHWRGALRWHAGLQAAGINPGRLASSWGGRLDGALTARGRDDTVQVDSLRVDGELAQHRFSATAAGGYAGGSATLQRLVVQSEKARLTASGRVGHDWALKAALAVPQAGELIPGAHGALKLHGRLDGVLRQPRLRLEGSAQELVLNTLRLGAARLHADIDLAGHLPWNLQLSLERAEAPPLHLLSARLSLTGSRRLQRITVEGRFGGGARLALTARGGWVGERWRGILGGGSLQLPGQAQWLAPAVRLVAGRDDTTLQRWCWRGSGHACVAFRAAQGRWDGDLDLAGVPLALLRPLLPRPDVTLAGRLSAGAQLAGQAGRVTRVALHGQVAGAAVTYPSPEGPIEMPLHTVGFSADSADGGLQARVTMTPAQGGATAQLHLQGWLPGRPLAAATPMRGSLQLHTSRLEWLTYFIPTLLHPSGTLDAHLDLGGSVGSPELSGRLALRDGAVRLPLAGIALSDVTIDGTSLNGRQLIVKGSARSGPGRLQLDGRLSARRLGTWRMEATLKGENFQLAHLSQASALVSPDLQLVMEAGRVDVRGALTVPQAQISLPQLSTTATVSPDTVIVDAPAASAARRWHMHLDLRLAAGDHVRLEGYGFSGRLTGAVRVQGDTPGITRAQGELRVEDGRYQAYGQNLTIQRGRLLFVDSPPNNPGLDVRAVRQLPDQRGLVGVEVSGRLMQPRLRIFSDPAMEQNEALSWLVLGRPLASASRSEADTLYRAAFAVGGTSAAQGIALRFGLDEFSVESGTATSQPAGTTTNQSAVVLGKYLSPRLYLQYAVGLWNTANQVRIRYRISPHWTLRMEDGDPSGADFLYSIER